MTSTNSLNSNRFLPTLKNVFKRNLAFYIVIQVIAALCAYLLTVFELQLIALTDYTEYDGYQPSITGTLSQYFLMFIIVTGTIWALAMAVRLFREIYNKRSSIFFFSMPVKRGVYYNANMLFGIFTLASMYAVLMVTAVIAIKNNTIVPQENFSFDVLQFITGTASSIITVLVLFAVFMLCAAVSGRRWHSYVLSYIATWLVFMSAANISSYVSTIWGLWVTPAKLWIISPIGCFISVAGDLAGSLKYVIALIIQFVLAYAVGYVAFKKRKAEAAESSPSGKIIPSVAIIICLVSCCFSFLATAELSLFARICAAVISAAISTVILTAIFYKKAFTKMTVKCLVGVLVSMFVIVCAVEFIPSISYEKYLPEIDEIESVSINENVDFSDDMFSRVWEIIIFDDYYAYDEIGSGFTVTGDEAKEKVLALHSKMIDDSTVDNVFSDDYYYHGHYSVRLTYMLKNGRTVTRSYCVGSKDIYDEYADLFRTDEVLRSIPPISINAEDIQYISVANRSYTVADWYYDTYGETYDEYGYYDYEIYEEYYASTTAYAELDNYEELLEQILKDRKNEPKDTFMSLINTSYYINDYNDYLRKDYSGSSEYGYPYVYEDYEEYYPDLKDIQISINTFSEFVTDEEKELIKALSPEEKEQYESEYIFNNKEGYVFNTEYVGINIEADTNTVEYLKSLGLIK